MHGETERKNAMATLREAARDGLRVIRIWVLGEGPRDADSWHRRWQLFRAGPDGWIPDAMAHLDLVLEQARALGLRVILTLANNWSDYGGIPQYLRWAGLGDGGGWGDLDRFFSDVRTRAWYRTHLERLLGRTSQVSGLRYVEDPTILGWELFNESAVTKEGRIRRRAFLREMARLVRARAPRQLVSAGVTDYGRVQDRDEWLAVCSMPEFSYCDGHLYPEESLRVQRREDLLSVIDDRVQLARYVARKPIVFGEYGFSKRPVAKQWLGKDEAQWHDAFLGRVHFNGAAGALPWIYVPYARPERRYAIWIDRESSEPVRKVLRRWARALAEGPPARTNPRLGASRGRRPLYPTEVEVTQDPSELAALVWQDAADGWELELPVEAFVRGRFEDMGVYRGGALAHVYGAGPGFIEYRLPASPSRFERLELWLRVSSEFPGATAPKNGLSRVRAFLGGRLIGAFTAPPDDGMGQGLSLRIEDRAAIATLSRGSAVLRFEVRRGPLANGLCIYGSKGSRPDPRMSGTAGPIRLIGRGKGLSPSSSGRKRPGS